MPGNRHAGFGGRVEETGRPKGQYRASARPYNYDVTPTADDDHEALATPIIATRPTKRQQFFRKHLVSMERPAPRSALG